MNISNLPIYTANSDLGRRRPARLRSFSAVAGAMALGGLVAGCSLASGDRPQDVGNMAYPAALDQGRLSTTSITSRAPRDTGNMAYPDPLPQGVISRTAVSARQFDTGNMAYPTPLPQGAGTNTRVQ